MRKKVSKQIRKLAKSQTDKDTEYLAQTFHHVYTGKDAQGDKTFMEVTDPINLAICARVVYKRLKNDYKANHKR